MQQVPNANCRGTMYLYNVALVDTRWTVRTTCKMSLDLVRNNAGGETPDPFALLPAEHSRCNR